MSNVKFKDVAHLYLGCRGLAIYNALNEDTGETIAIMLPAVRRLLSVSLDSLTWEGGRFQTKIVKPILRPLSDMNSGERAHYQNVFKDCMIKHKGKHVNDAYAVHTGNANGESIAYLLSKHFDLFGLIESGEAIDATALPVNPYKTSIHE